MFEGATGRELQTIPYKPARHDDGLMWGDYAMARIEPGNRVDRFLAGVAYLDGRRPSAVFARGYYTRATVVAYRPRRERPRSRIRFRPNAPCGSCRPTAPIPIRAGAGRVRRDMSSAYRV